MADGMKIVSDRWMLQSRQIVNWGSYGGWHEFRPSMDDTMPVTLLAGASESIARSSVFVPTTVIASSDCAEALACA